MSNNKFKIIETPIDGLSVIEPTVFGDARGFFMETFSERDFRELGIDQRFVQDNHSRSNRGVLRGMHFQSRNTQAKLVRVISGSVYDVVVDLRPESSTFGQWYGIELSARNRFQLYVPQRFAHGFVTLEDNTEFLYKCSDYYNPEADGGIAWNDPQVGIDWKLDSFKITAAEITLSDKDSRQPSFNSIDWTKEWK